VDGDFGFIGEMLQSAEDLRRAAKGSGTVIVHARLGRDEAEARAMASDWSKRVDRELEARFEEMVQRAT